jgi:hypothetical protein
LGLVLDVVAALPTPPVSADISERVLAELERPQVVRLRPPRRWAVLSAAAAVVAALSIPLGYWIGRQNAGSPDNRPLAKGSSTAGKRPDGVDRPDGADPSPEWARETEQRLAEAFWPEPLGADGRPVATGDQSRWGQDVQTSLEPLTRSTAAALDSLWQAIPAVAEDSRS